jgi:hypothetical protein
MNEIFLIGFAVDYWHSKVFLGFNFSGQPPSLHRFSKRSLLFKLENFEIALFLMVGFCSLLKCDQRP